MLRAAHVDRRTCMSRLLSLFRSTSPYLSAALLTVWLAWNLGPALGSRVLYYRDTLWKAVPDRVYAAKCIRGGQFPSWTSDSACGIALHGDGQSGYTYPGFMSYLLFPSAQGNDLFVALHLALAGWGVFVLTRSLGVQPMICATAAIWHTTDRWLDELIATPWLLAAYAWLPWLLWLADRAAQGHRRAVWWAGIVWSLALLTGGYNLVIVMGPVVAGYYLFRSRGQSWRVRLSTLAAMVAIASPLAASQLVPSYQFYLTSNRAAENVWEQARNYVVPPLTLLPWDETFVSEGTQTDYHMPPIWLQAVTLVGTLIGSGFALAWARRQGAWFWLAISAAAITVSTCTPVARLLYFVPPFAWFRYPYMFLFAFVLAMPVLASLGWNACWQRLIAAGRGGLADAVLAGLALAGSFSAYHHIGRQLGPAELSSTVDAGLKAVVDASRQSGEHVRMATIDTEEDGLLGTDWTWAGHLRAVAALPPDYNLLFDAPSAFCDEVEGTVVPRDVCEVLSLAKTAPETVFGVCAVTHLSGVTRREQPQAELVQESPTFLWRRQTNPRRAWMVYDATVIEDRQRRLDFLRTGKLEYQRQAIVETPVVLGPAPTKDAAVSCRQSGIHSLQVNVETAATGLLVIADSYDPHVRASLNGRPIEVLRVNHAFRGIIVPPGTHRIDTWFEPTGFRLGWTISCLAWMAVLFKLFGDDDWRRWWPYAALGFTLLLAGYWLSATRP